MLFVYFYHRNNQLEVNKKLDLHGLHTDEAVAALDRIIPLKEKGKHNIFPIV